MDNNILKIIMGNTRSFFPKGYNEWMNTAKLDKHELTKENYKLLYNDQSQKTVQRIKNECVQNINMIIAKGMREFVIYKYKKENVITMYETEILEMLKIIPDDAMERMTEVFNKFMYEKIRFESDPDEEYIEDTYCRTIYDAFVEDKICDYWLKLLELPYDKVQKYYDEHPLDLEQIFSDVEKEYDVPCTVRELVEMCRFSF